MTPRIALPLLSFAAVAAFAAFAALPVSAGPDTPAAPAVIRIDATAAPVPVSPLLYGHNSEAADERNIFGPPPSPQSKPTPATVNTGKGLWDPAGHRPDPEAVADLTALRCGMLRYPGGCLVHNYDWRRTVGPIESRPDWRFGLDEYLAFCKAVGAEPWITLTDYLMEPEELPRHAAELVEYLNAPALPRYPQAMKRAANGHPEPYGVRYFEIGNECYHGNSEFHRLTPKRKFTPQSYVDFARKTIAAVRQVDPTVKLGVCGHQLNDSPAPDEWDSTVYAELGPIADFVVHHPYMPVLENHTPQEALESTLLTGEMLRVRLQNYRRQTEALAGRPVPAALTEFNIKNHQNQPRPWRHTYLAGLNMAEFLLEFRRPENQVFAASYWQAVGGYFGMVDKGADGRRAYNGVWPFFRTLAARTGRELLPVAITDNPRREVTAGKIGQVPAVGDRLVMPAELGEIAVRPIPAGKLGNNCGFSVEEGVFRFRFTGSDQTFYANFIEMDRPDGTAGYTLNAEFEARFLPDEGNSGNAALGFGLMDRRGWAATRVAAMVSGLEAGREFRKFRCGLAFSPDSPGATGLLRFERPEGALHGTLELRNVKLTATGGVQLPAIPLLRAEASRLADGKLALAVINRSPDRALAARIETEGFRVSAVSALELYREDVTETVAFEPVARSAEPEDGNGFLWNFPPHSLTVFELDGAPSPRP